MNLTLDIRDDGVNQALARMLAVAETPAVYLGAVGNAVADNARLRFGQGVAPDGTPWQPLSPVTIARRRGNGVGAQPLLDTGLLRNSITSEVDGDSVVVGTNKRQGAMLQLGAGQGQFGRGRYRTRRGSFPIPWGDVPPRPYLGISSDDRDAIDDVLTRAISGDKT